MPGELDRKSRIEASITPDALPIVRRADEITGRSLGDFTAAQEVAHRIIEKE